VGLTAQAGGLADDLEATTLVQAPGRVVRLDAEAQRLVALFTRRPDERLEQERTDAPPSMRRHYADRQLRRLGVDEAVPTVVLGQQAQPCRADRWPVLGDHPQVAYPRPSSDVVRYLRSAQDRLDVPLRAVGSPEERCNEHLSEEVAVSWTGATDADSHSGRVPQRRPLDHRPTGGGYGPPDRCRP